MLPLNRFLELSNLICVSLISIFLGTAISLASGEETGGAAEASLESMPRTVEEARGRARWIHELMHGTLQVMHRDFFDDEETRKIPSASLEDVFAEMARSWSVGIRWLGGNATKDIDHEPEDRFEEAAVEALINGAPEYEAIQSDHFRFVGAIRLQNECLKCHVPNRTSLEDRVAGLSISIPMHPGKE